MPTPEPVGSIREALPPRLASHMLPHFQDLGTFATSPQMLATVAPERRERALDWQGQLVQLRTTIDALEKQCSAREKTAGAMAQGELRNSIFAMTAVRAATKGATPFEDEVHAARDEFRDYGDVTRKDLRRQYRAEQHLTAALFSCLPASMRIAFHEALISTGVLNAHWDLLNHRGANAGFYPDYAWRPTDKNPGPECYRVAVVDGGNTHSSGFSGQLKAESFVAVLGLPALTATGLANRLHLRDLDADVSKSGWAGVDVPPGGVPRSDVYVEILRRQSQLYPEGTDLRQSEPHLAAAYRLRCLLPTLSHELGRRLDNMAAAARSGHADGFFTQRVMDARKRVSAYINVIGNEAIDRWVGKDHVEVHRIDHEIRVGAPATARVGTHATSSRRANSAPARLRFPPTGNLVL
ncbi:hypothetical protein [Ralstonia psammae]|uniref:hypothetical protein n=1 Tax=Ralstonia psammae TaxID=3058598 RepID=UPI00293105A1|nr:hypothetical protein [Ralstonia sp. LMG 19083]